MKKDYDEPKYIDIKRTQDDKDIIDKTIEDIKQLCKEQSFGVLSTQGNGECYTSLISFQTSTDLSQIVFATPIDTKKFEFIKQNDSVSILIDNRSNNPESINNIVAVTAMGRVKILEEKDLIEKWSKLLIDKHSYLKNFIKASTTAIVVVQISKYYYVSSFQEVVEIGRASCRERV